jgi:mRNA interferase MazF
VADVFLQGDIWWADLSDPPGSTSGYRRPVVILQGDAINRSRIATLICAPLTSNMKWAEAPGNLACSARSTGLDRDSVVQMTLILTIDKVILTEQVGRISQKQVKQLLGGLDILFERDGLA